MVLTKFHECRLNLPKTTHSHCNGPTIQLCSSAIDAQLSSE